MPLSVLVKVQLMTSRLDTPPGLVFPPTDMPWPAPKAQLVMMMSEQFPEAAMLSSPQLMEEFSMRMFCPATSMPSVLCESLGIRGDGKDW